MNLNDDRIKDRGYISKAFRTAFPYTTPIMVSFLFIGTAYGLYMSINGFSFWYPMLMALTIFGGSLEFVAAEMLLGTFAPWETLIVALAIQSRHIFYGIAMLKRYKGTGWKKPYLIFGMCDESFAINHSAEIPEDVDKGWFMFFVTLLNQSYWVIGAALGGLIGPLITFDTTGLEFVMTALFVVIFIEQCMKEKKLYTAVIGLAASVVCLVIFGGNSFIIPTLLVILILLTVFRKEIRRAYDGSD